MSTVANNPRGLWEYESNVVALVKFRQGVIAELGTIRRQDPYTFNVDLLGTEGGIRDNRLWIPKLLPGQKQWSTFPTITPDTPDVHHHPFDAQINHFVDCIRHDVESHCNIADSFATHECASRSTNRSPPGAVLCGYRSECYCPLPDHAADTAILSGE